MPWRVMLEWRVRGGGKGEEEGEGVTWSVTHAKRTKEAVGASLHHPIITFTIEHHVRCPAAWPGRYCAASPRLRRAAQ